MVCWHYISWLKDVFASSSGSGSGSGGDGGGGGGGGGSSSRSSSIKLFTVNLKQSTLTYSPLTQKSKLFIEEHFSVYFLKQFIPAL